MWLMCYNLFMNTTIRNLDPVIYRRAKAVAALQGKTIGQIVNEALEAYVTTRSLARDRSLAELEPEPFPPGNERLSEEIDAIVYGT